MQHLQSGSTLQAAQALTCVPQLRQGAGELRLDGHLQGRTGRTGVRITDNLQHAVGGLSAAIRTDPTPAIVPTL
jgi:hypothetical protein